MVTNSGLAIVTNRMIGSGTEPKFAAMGTGTTAPATTDTTLGTEVETRSGTNAGTRTTTTATNDTNQWQQTQSITSGRAITEAGLFDASSTGNMLCRGTFAAINLVSGESIQWTWKVVFTGG